MFGSTDPLSVLLKSTSVMREGQVLLFHFCSDLFNSETVCNVWAMSATVSQLATLRRRENL